MKYIILTLILTSCYSPKFAEKYIDKIQYYHPEVLQKKSTQYYPCGWKIVMMSKEDSALADCLFSGGN